MGSGLVRSEALLGMVGVIGEMDFFPIFNEGETHSDLFINVTRYEVDADSALIMCPLY